MDRIKNMTLFCLGACMLIIGTLSGCAALIGNALIRDAHTDSLFGTAFLAAVLLVAGSLLVGAATRQGASSS